jgi:hypothetical protein
MKQEFEKKYFAAADCGLNADDVDIAVGENQWVNLVDARVGTTDNGVTGVVESIGGTRTLTSPQPSITFINIGSAVDTARNRFFYFQYNKYTNEHRIYCYQADTDEILTVLSASQVTGGLGFNKNYLITNARVVGDMLYWTDNLNEPRRINVEAALKLNNPSYNTDVEPYTSPLAQSVIKLIRRPPGRVLSVTPVTEGLKPNFIKYFAGQFAIRYVYRDGEISVVGPPSDMVNYRLAVSNPSGAVVDTSDAIDIEINTPALSGEYIEQDVQIVQYLVRYNNQPEYFVIKEWNKDNATDAAAIAAYNAGGALTFRFYNDGNISAISQADSVKPYDSVPLLSETLELGLSRLFLGNNKVGYDTPATTSLTAAMSTPGSVTQCAEIWKPYSTYQLGIRFRDNEKRMSGVVTNSSLVVTVPDRGDFNDNSFSQYINFTLSNTNALTEIPDWAYYYDILITKNLRTRFFVQWMPNFIRYAVKNNDGTFTYNTSYSSNIYGVGVDTSALASQGQGVVYTQGDRIRFYLTGLSIMPFDLEVIGQDGNYVITRPYNFGTTTSSSLLDMIVEYYTPYYQSGNEIFYTTSACYRVSAPGTDMRQYSTLSGQLEGDTYFISRLTQILSITYYTVCMSPSDDRWKDWFDTYGEANIVTLLGQVQKTSSVKWSNTLIEGSLVNGLSTFDALDEKLLPQSMGPLRKLQQTSKVQQQGNIMLAIGEDETASLYLGEVQVVGSDANAFLASSPNVIGTVNVLKGSFGTTHPESVTEYRGNVYWWDDVNARIVQYSTGGLYPISNYKMTRYWKQFTDTFKSLTTAQIEALDIFNRPFVFTTVDPYHDELLISVPKLLSTPPKGYLPDYPDVIYPFDIWDGQSKVLVFKVGTNPNFWQGSYSFSSEGFVTLGSNLYSFKYGQVFVHNQPNVNQFYDDIQRYKPKIMAVFNKEGNLPKVYNAIKVEGNLVPTFTYFRSESPYVQASDLMDFDYTNYEGMLYATLYRNKIVPTASGYTTDGLITAEKVRTNALRVMMEFTIIDEPLQLRYLTMEYILSKGHLI